MLYSHEQLYIHICVQMEKHICIMRIWSSFQHLLSNWSDLQLLNRGSWGPPLLGAGYLYIILSPTDLISNTNFLCTELYYCFTSTQLNLSTVKVIPLIPSTGYTCYLHRCISYFDSSAGVNMQHIQALLQFLHC